MKMRDVIDMVSKIYRDEQGKLFKLNTELLTVDNKIQKANDNEWTRITVADYQKLLNEQSDLRMNIIEKKSYIKGISFVREMLMDLGFDMEIES